MQTRTPHARRGWRVGSGFCVGETNDGSGEVGQEFFGRGVEFFGSFVGPGADHGADAGDQVVADVGGLCESAHESGGVREFDAVGGDGQVGRGV